MTGYHGLPADYGTPEGEREDWEATSGYLDALEGGRRPVVVAIVDHRLAKLHPGSQGHLMQQIGFLRRSPISSGHQPGLHRFCLNWPDPDQACGEFGLDERLFEGSRLSTDDGDDYFTLAINLGPTAVWVLDSNTNMFSAYTEWTKRRHETYLGLPSPTEIEEKWRAEPNPEVIQRWKEEMGRLRSALVKSGATAAAELTDAELAAGTERVSWNIRTSGRMDKVPQSEWEKLWFDEFVGNLKARADSD